MNFGPVTPILRIFDEAKVREFYVDFLEFKVDWEHRFEPGLPLYMGVSKDAAVLHLSEHFGDGTPGTHLRIDCDDVDAFQQFCSLRNTKTPDRACRIKHGGRAR